MQDQSWTIREDDGDWQVLAEETKAALAQAAPFTRESRESTRRHHAGFSLREAVVLAADGGTIPLARFMLDACERERLSEQDWRMVAAFLQSLQQPFKQGPGRPYQLDRKAHQEAEYKAAQLVAKSQADWRVRHNHKRVPGVETNIMIGNAISKVAAETGALTITDLGAQCSQSAEKWALLAIAQLLSANVVP